MKKGIIGFLALVFLSIVPMVVSAATMDNQFDFTIGGPDEETPAGSFSYSDGDINGFGILISGLTITNYGQSPVKYDTTGFTLQINAENDGDASLWHWNSGSLSIKDNAGLVVFSGSLNNLLLEKDFYAKKFSLSIGGIYNNESSFISSFNDDKYDGYMNFAPSTTYTTTLDMAFYVDGLNINPESLNPFNANVTGGNVHGQNPVPVPAAAWIFLTGIAGLAGLRRKNKK